MKNPSKNNEGYSDPTAHHAIKNVTKHEKKVNEVVGVMCHMAHLADFDVVGKIILKERKQK